MIIANEHVVKTKWVIKLVKQLPKGTGFGRTYTGKNLYLNDKGRFSGLSKNTWIFETKKEANIYCGDIFDWGCLEDYSVIEKVKVEISIEITKP